MIQFRMPRCRSISSSLIAAGVVCGAFSASVTAQTLPPDIAVPPPAVTAEPETIVIDDEPGVVELAPPATMQPAPQHAAPMQYHAPQPRPMQPYTRTTAECPAPRSILYLVPSPRECMDGLVEGYHNKKAYPTYLDDYLRNCFLCCCPWCPSQCEPPQMSKKGLDIHGQIDFPTFGSSRVIYPANPYYFDPRDGKVYAAQGYGMPVGMPLAPNVEHAYNYSHGTPASRLTPISRQTTQP